MIIILLVSSVQCSKPAVHKAIVVLVDLSESTNKPEMRDLYINSFKKIVDLISNGDSLFVAPITEKSIMELNFVVEEPNLVPINVNFDTNLKERRKIERKPG